MGGLGAPLFTVIKGAYGLYLWFMGAFFVYVKYKAAKKNPGHATLLNVGDMAFGQKGG